MTSVAILLIIVAVSLFLAEVLVTSHGVLGIVGTLALVAGGLMLLKDTKEFGVSGPAVGAVGVMLAGFFVLAGAKSWKARGLEVRTGWEELVGLTGKVRIPLTPEGQIFVQGALWQARSADGQTIERDDTVTVQQVEGLVLVVARTHPNEPALPDPR